MTADPLRLVRIREHTQVALRRALDHRQPRAELEDVLRWLQVGTVDRALVLEGPRRTGKSTLLEHTLASLADETEVDAWYVDFTASEVADVGIPGVLDAIGANADDAGRTVLLLDEPHYIEGWERQLKRAVDERRCRLIVADSSSAVAAAASEAGAGRWSRLPILPLEFPAWLSLRAGYGVPPPTTAHQRFAACDEWLRRGGMPLAELLLPTADLLLGHRFLEQDIAMAAIRGDAAAGTNPRPLERLFGWLVRDSGTLLDKTKAAQVAQGSRPSIDGWLQRLYDTGLLWELAPWAGSTPKRLRKRPKVYAADPGLVAASTPGGHIPGDRKLLGRLVETSCAAACRSALQRHGGELGYFLVERKAGRGNAGEADFVLGDATRRFVLEAKAGDGRGASKRAAEVAKSAGAGTVTIAARTMARSTETVDGVTVHVVPLPDVLTCLAKGGPEALLWS